MQTKKEEQDKEQNISKSGKKVVKNTQIQKQEKKITSYFLKTEQVTNTNRKKNDATSTRLIESMSIEVERLLKLKEDTIAKKNAIQENISLAKQESHLYLQKSKALVTKILKSNSQYWSHSKKLKKMLKINTVSQRSLKNRIAAKKQLLISNNIDPLQSFFLEQEINQLQMEFNKLQTQSQIEEEQFRLLDEEKNCRFSQEKWPILNRKYQILELIGKGGFSEVYRSYNIEKNHFVGIKMSSLSSLSQFSNKTQYMKRAMRQCEIHKHLSHKNIAKLYQVLQIDSQTLCLVLEYCQGVQLSKYLKIRSTVCETQCKLIIMQVLDSLKYLSQLPSKIIHYDLKPQNIMFHHGQIKILDFGLCKSIQQGKSKIQLTSQGAGSYWYLPPESFEPTATMISNKVDIWSVGVIYYELLYGRKPFAHEMTPEKIYKTGAILHAQKVTFPETPQVTSQTKNFIERCLEADDNLRMDVVQAYDDLKSYIA